MLFKNNHEQAQKIAGNAQKVTLFLGKVQELQNKWTEIYGKGSLKRFKGSEQPTCRQMNW